MLSSYSMWPVPVLAMNTVWKSEKHADFLSYRNCSTAFRFIKCYLVALYGDIYFKALYIPDTYIIQVSSSLWICTISPKLKPWKLVPLPPVTQFLCQLILFFIKSIKPFLGILTSRNLFEERHWLIFALPTVWKWT